MKTGSIVLTEAMSAQEFASAAGKLKGGLWRYAKQEEIENGVMVVSLTKRSVVDSIKAALKPKDSLAAKHVIASLNARFGAHPQVSKNVIFQVKQKAAGDIQHAATLAALRNYRSHDIYG